MFNINKNNQNKNIEKRNNNAARFQMKSKNVVVFFFSFVLIILVVLGVALGIHFTHNKSSNPKPTPPNPKPTPPNPKPKPGTIDVNKKFLILNTTNSTDFQIPDTINNGKANHFAPDSFKDLPNKQYLLDFSNKDNIQMGINSNAAGGYNYSIFWDVKIDNGKNGTHMIVDNYYGFNFKSKDDYKILDTAPKETKIDKNYYLSIQQNMENGYFYTAPDKFVSWPEGFTKEGSVITIPLQKLDNLQIIPGNYTPNEDSKDINYKNKISWYDPDNEVNVTFYSNSLRCVPNQNIPSNNEARPFRLDTEQDWDSQGVESAILTYPGEKDYDLGKKTSIYKLIDSKLISNFNPNEPYLYFYQNAVDKNKKPLIFTLSVTLANKNIKYTFNISDVPKNTTEFRLVWNESTKEMHVLGYNASGETGEIQMQKKN